LAPGTINGRLAAVRRLAYEAADSGLLSPEVAAGIRRVKGAKYLSVRLGNWLTAEQARALWQVPDCTTLKGKRDRALLAVLLGCGLRRREAAELHLANLQRREDHWAIVDLIGKAGKSWGDGMMEGVVWHVVRDCAKKAGIEKLAPHDLRRTCARLCHAAGGELEQIQFLLGHVSVQTTEKYLGCQQRIRGAVNDRIGIEPLQ
jgi:site-specific recombinase XerD